MPQSNILFITSMSEVTLSGDGSIIYQRVMRTERAVDPKLCSLGDNGLYGCFAGRSFVFHPS